MSGLNAIACQSKFEEFFNGVNWPIQQPQTIFDANTITGTKWREALVELNQYMLSSPLPLIPLEVQTHALAFEASMIVTCVAIISYLSTYANSLANSMVGKPYKTGFIVSSSPPPSPFVFPPAGFNNPTLVSTLLAAELYTWMTTGQIQWLEFFIILHTEPWS